MLDVQLYYGPSGKAEYPQHKHHNKNNKHQFNNKLRFIYKREGYYTITMSCTGNTTTAYTKQAEAFAGESRVVNRAWRL